MERDTWSTLASGTWRFKPNHRIGFQSFSTRRSNTKVTEQELVIDDQTIPAGTELKTSAKTDFLVANYQYSLLRDDRVELSAMAGIYGARFKYGFDSTNPPRNIESKTTAPLPMFGISLDTFLTPRWTVSTFFEGFALKVENVKGSIAYIGLSTDYMLTRHFGLAWVSARCTSAPTLTGQRRPAQLRLALEQRLRLRAASLLAPTTHHRQVAPIIGPLKPGRLKLLPAFISYAR